MIPIRIQALPLSAASECSSEWAVDLTVRHEEGP
jgi:hypothetical protein